MKRAVVLCADDYGMSEGVSRGIAELAGAGRISAASVMTGGPAWPAEAAGLRPLAGRVGIGLHLTLTWGAPLGPMPGFAPGGRLPPLGRAVRTALSGRLPVAEIEGEIARQLQAFADALGREPDFVDGHQHVHALPGIRSALLRVLARRGLAGRVWLRNPGDRPSAILARRSEVAKAAIVAALSAGFRAEAEEAGFWTNRGFSGFSSFADRDTGVDFDRSLAALGPAHLVMCHPGHVADGEVLDGVTGSRRRELAYLASPAWPELLAACGVELVPKPT